MILNKSIDNSRDVNTRTYFLKKSMIKLWTVLYKREAFNSWYHICYLSPASLLYSCLHNIKAVAPTQFDQTLMLFSSANTNGEKKISNLDSVLSKCLAYCHGVTTILKDACSIFVLCARYIFFLSLPWRQKYPALINRAMLRTMESTPCLQHLKTLPLGT